MRRYNAAVTEEKSTRDCLDPWFFAMLNARRELLPCCWHPPIGALPVGGSLDELLNGEAIRELRQQLLSGNLNVHCRACPSRPLAAPAALRERLIRELAEPPDFSAGTES